MTELLRLIKRWYRLHILKLPYGIVLALEIKDSMEDHQ